MNNLEGWNLGISTATKVTPRFEGEAVLTLNPLAEGVRANRTMSFSKHAIKVLGLDLSSSTKETPVCVEYATNGDRTALVTGQGNYWVHKNRNMSNKALYETLVTRFNLDDKKENNFLLVPINETIFALTEYNATNVELNANVIQETEVPAELDSLSTDNVDFEAVEMDSLETEVGQEYSETGY